MYKFHNANPYGRHISDCVIRALSILKSEPWEKVYDELCDLSGDVGMLFNDVEFVEDYLDKRYPRECHYAKTVGEFANEYRIGKYAITMNGHITALIDGVIIDTFDPRGNIMRCSWKIE